MDPQQTAGPGDSAGPAGEQMVSKEKREDVTEDLTEAVMGQSATPAGDGPPAGDTVAEPEVIVGEVVPDETGEAVAPPASESKPLGAELEALRSELDERTRDLQRVSAEYANYRKRVERDRGAVVEQATGLVISALLPILDDLDRAREHGDLVGPFAVMAVQPAVGTRPDPARLVDCDDGPVTRSVRNIHYGGLGRDEVAVRRVQPAGAASTEQFAYADVVGVMVGRPAAAVAGVDRGAIVEQEPNRVD